MSARKLLVVVALALAVLLDLMTAHRHQAHAKDLCKRPSKAFANTNLLDDYINCIKFQSTRYGKRAYSPLLGRLRPDLYNDYDSWPIYDVAREN